jgi:hypothetical protein
MKSYTLTSAPAVEPATLAEFMTFGRITSGAEDASLAIMLAAGREYVESYTGRALITQTWKMTAPTWFETQSQFQNFTWLYGIPLPSAACGLGNGFWPDYNTPPPNGDVNAVVLSRSPLQSVTSVKYYPADNGAQVTLTEGTDYAVSAVATPGRVTPAVNTSWPALAARPDAVEIVFVAGYGATSADVPAMLRLATLSLAAWFYDQRAPAAIGNIVNDLPHSLTAILDKHRVGGMLG